MIETLSTRNPSNSFGWVVARKSAFSMIEGEVGEVCDMAESDDMTIEGLIMEPDLGAVEATPS